MTGKQERQRKLAREHMERQQIRRAAQQRRWQITGIITGAVVLIAALSVAGYLALGSGKSTANAASPTATPTPTGSATPTPSASPSTTASAAAVTEPAKHCTYYPTAGQPAARKVHFPPSVPAWQAAYNASIVTSRGTIDIHLLNSKATCTVNSFVSLASQSYFSNTPCHRLVTAGIFVLQCGDPTGTGQGGPGYRFANENLTGATYPTGTVAMANAGANTNGSQFFLVYKNSPLPPSYTPFGTITSGLGVIQTVAKAGSDNSNGQGDGHPKDKVEIERVIITKN